MQQLVLKAGQLIDGNGQLLENAALVIENKRIAYVGTAEAAVYEPNAKVVELPKATIVPGFIDAHVHLDLPPVGGIRKGGSFEPNPMPPPPFEV